MSIAETVRAIDHMRAALEEIKRLHSVRILQKGQSAWRAGCQVCCCDESGHQTEDCLGSHEHTLNGPVCSTAEIIARAGL